jgi:hypothetical protein
MAEQPVMPATLGRPTQAAESRWPTWLRTAAIGALAGLTAGLIVGGVGGRLAMRAVVLATNRFPTESSQGTLGILIVGAVLGATLGLLYVALRRWLPRGWRAPGLIYGLILLAVPGVAFFVEGLFHADSELREGPVALGIGLFSLLIVGYALALAGLVAWLDGRLLPATTSRPFALAGYGLAALRGRVGAAPGTFALVGMLASAISTLLTGQPLRLPPIA